MEDTLNQIELPQVSIDDLLKMIGDRDVTIHRLQILTQRQANEIDALKAKS